MIKADEITFLIMMQLNTTIPTRQIIKELAHLIPEKRALYLLDKWTGKGWYDYGTVIDGGWLTEAGKAASYEKEWQHQCDVLNT